MNAVKTKIERYWNWRSASYDLDIEKSPETEKAWQNAIKTLTRNDQRQKGLDIGTGPGQLAFYLAEADFEVTALDISSKMISRAQKTAREKKLTIDFRTGDAEKLDFADNSFDVIVSRNMIWTLPNPDQALNEWHRVLKPGGRIIISDGFWDNLTWKQPYKLLLDFVRNIKVSHSKISLRFFFHYASIAHDLPLYEGVNMTRMLQLLQGAGFKKISSLDISKHFKKHPYAIIEKNNPSFFIVYADKQQIESEQFIGIAAST